WLWWGTPLEAKFWRHSVPEPQSIYSVPELRRILETPVYLVSLWVKPYVNITCTVVKFYVLKIEFKRSNMYKTFVNHMLRNVKTFVNGASSHDFSTNSLDLEINRIVWMDMEMTGLNVDQDKIMEVACLVTDSDLNIVAEGPDIVIHQPENILNNMHEWCVNQHGKTGLTQACLKSTTTLEEAESILLNFIRKHVTEKCSPLAGNSIYMDRLFLKKHMPRVDDFLHYRIIDVSTEMESRDIQKIFPKKQFSHRALQDIKESVDELKFYKDNFFKHATLFTNVQTYKHCVVKIISCNNSVGPNFEMCAFSVLQYTEQCLQHLHTNGPYLSTALEPTDRGSADGSDGHLWYHPLDASARQTFTEQIQSPIRNATQSSVAALELSELSVQTNYHMLLF
ncbi:hypothetical protein NQ318_002348, partial [Aromia moschata]